MERVAEQEGPGQPLAGTSAAVLQRKVTHDKGKSGGIAR